MVAAIRYALDQADWKAGDYNIGYQVCDDATAQAAKWDSGKCSQNANAYAANDKVIGVIGTFNSGCAAIEIPVLNQAPEGGIPMVSPANTYTCLTKGGPSCDSTEPDKYYPSGSRNYVRVVANDDYQGAAVAEFAKAQGVTNVYVLNDKEAYGLGVATTFRNAAESLGIKIAGFEAWDPKASSYESLFRKIGQSGADGVFLGGLIDENGAQVIKDKVAVLGPNDGAVKLLAPDGFTQQSTIDESGAAARGMFMSIAGVPIDTFKGAALEGSAVDAIRLSLNGGTHVLGLKEALRSLAGESSYPYIAGVSGDAFWITYYLKTRDLNWGGLAPDVLRRGLENFGFRCSFVDEVEEDAAFEALKTALADGSTVITPLHVPAATVLGCGGAQP